MSPFFVVRFFFDAPVLFLLEPAILVRRDGYGSLVVESMRRFFFSEGVSRNYKEFQRILHQDWVSVVPLLWLNSLIVL